MNQTSSSAYQWLLSTFQITIAAILIAATFVLMQNSEKAPTKTLNNYPASPVARALYETDGSAQPTIAQCRFDDADSWSAPVTDHVVAEPGLRWGSNVDNNGLGVTAPLSIQPTQPSVSIAQLPEEFAMGQAPIPQTGETGGEELGSWGSLTAEEIEMIQRQRQEDIGLDAVEKLEADFPADEFGSADWKDPLAEDSKTRGNPEPMIDAIVVENTPSDTATLDPEFEGVSPEELALEELEELGQPEALEGLGQPEALQEIGQPLEPGELSGLIETSESEPMIEETEIVEPGPDKLLETGTPLEDSVLEDSLREHSNSEDFGDDFIPLIDLPKDEPELTAQEKERNDLKMAPLPKFNKSKDIIGVFDDPVVAIKALPKLKGKKSKHPLKPLKRNHTNPTWWADKIHQPQFSDRQPLETTLDEVIFMALRAAPQIQILNTQPQVQRAIRDEAAAGFDWSTFVNSTYNDINEPIGSSLTAGGAVTEFIQREWVFESGLRKRLRSGGDISIGQNFGTLDSNSTFLIPDNQGNSQLVLDYRQPLLQGAGQSFNTSQIALASLDLESISGESLAELNVYLLEVVGAYWNIYLQRAMLIQNRQSVKLAEELYRQLESREGIDVRNDQLLRAEAAVASRRSAMIRSEYDLINAQDTLINLVLGAKSETVDEIELLPEPIILPMGLQVETEQLVQAAIRNRPEIRSAIAQIRSSAIRKQVAANQLLPRLDAVVSSFVSGLRGDRDIGGSFTDQFSTGEPSYTVGFEFEVPIGNRAAKSRFQRSQLEAQVLHRQFERQVGDVVLDARIAGREIERLNRENETNFKGLQKAALELDLIQQRQQLNLDNARTGSLYIEDLLASQARLTAAEIRLAQSQASQAIALIDVKRATGELLNSGGAVQQTVTYEAVPFESGVIEENFVQPNFVQPNFDQPNFAQPTPADLQLGTQPVNSSNPLFNSGS